MNGQKLRLGFVRPASGRCRSRGGSVSSVSMAGGSEDSGGLVGAGGRRSRRKGSHGRSSNRSRTVPCVLFLHLVVAELPLLLLVAILRLGVRGSLGSGLVRVAAAVGRCGCVRPGWLLLLRFPRVRCRRRSRYNLHRETMRLLWRRWRGGRSGGRKGLGRGRWAQWRALCFGGGLRACQCDQLRPALFLLMRLRCRRRWPRESRRSGTVGAGGAVADRSS